MTLPRAIVVWVLLLAIAVANGAARELFLVPRLGAQAGHVLSTVILCGAIVFIALLTLRWIAPRGRRAALWIGGVWLALTLAFEFLAGHYLFGNSWEKLLGEYNLLRGRIWILVLATTLFAPAFAYGWTRSAK